MVFNLRSKKDLIWVTVLLLVFNFIEYLMPSRVTSISAYIIGGLSFISIMEICLYLIKRNSTLIFFILGISLLVFFNLDHGFFGYPYVYGTDVGFIVSILFKLYNRKNKADD